MGLQYRADESATLKTALAANLATASSMLDQLKRASDHLISALNGGELSGKGYAAVEALFAHVVLPTIAATKTALAGIQKELETYSSEDEKVNRFGVLKEDELNIQLTATTAQRDATKRLIEANTAAADAVTAVPGLGDALR
jgi:hypothetical protein